MTKPPIIRIRAERGDPRSRTPDEQKQIKARKAKRLRHAAAMLLMKTRPDEVVIGAVDGRVMVRKTVTRPCKKCGNDFSFLMTTRVRWYCEDCRVIVEREKHAANKQRAKTRPKRKPWPRKGQRLIRYAGYDPTEYVRESSYAKTEEERPARDDGR